MLLLALQSLGVAFAAGQLGQEMLDQRRHRCISLSGLNAGSSIGLSSSVKVSTKH
jgi:hypothetical protein